MRKFVHSVFTICLLALTSSAAIAGEKSFGEYAIHYSAFNADFLNPSVAKAYGIQRSKNRAVLNVTVLKKADKALPKPVKADVSGTAITVYQKARPLKLREVKDQDTYYYIAEFPVTNEETLNFKVSARANGKDIGTVSFQQQFFTQ
ncbi:MAG TPA: DUF4426 domain-containing protein [Chromatiales bacterium]|nr:DUF4426 domain-containing protein [Thiotrichales bacterium]HIP68924.1 DUF4426 domain-containing protein [Chromatiales bacterium]